MARFRNITTATAVEEQGGTVNFGALDSSLYTGDINYVTVTEQTYWRIPCLGMTVGGNSVDIATSGASPSAAIDTGTTLIAVPTATAQALYAALSSEAQAVTESGFQGYWQYPCDLNVEVALNFGGVSYTISNGDFNIGRLSRNSNLCLGGIYGTDLGSTSTIQWIVGATFVRRFSFSPLCLFHKLTLCTAQERLFDLQILQGELGLPGRLRLARQRRNRLQHHQQ